MPVLFRFGRKDGSIFFASSLAFYSDVNFHRRNHRPEIGVVKVILWIFSKSSSSSELPVLRLFILEIIISSGNSAGGNCESEKFSNF